MKWRSHREGGERTRNETKVRLRIKSKLDHNEHTNVDIYEKKPFVDDGNLVPIEWRTDEPSLKHSQFKLTAAAYCSLLATVTGGLTVWPNTNRNLCIRCSFIAHHKNTSYIVRWATENIWYWITLQYFVCDEWQKVGSNVHAWHFVIRSNWLTINILQFEM